MKPAARILTGLVLFAASGLGGAPVRDALTRGSESLTRGS